MNKQLLIVIFISLLIILIPALLISLGLYFFLGGFLQWLLISIGAIFVISERFEVGKLFMISLLFLVLTIAMNLLNNIFNSKHYEKVIDEKMESCGYKRTKWGGWAEKCYWAFIGSFFLSILIFVIALFSVIF